MAGEVVIDRSAAPGWADRAWVRLGAARPRLMSSSQIGQALADSERLLSRVHAAQARLLAELARPARWEQAADMVAGMTGRLTANQDRPAPLDRDLDVVEGLLTGPAQRMAAAEAAPAMGISPAAAARRMADAVDLVAELPATLNALHDGVIDRAVAFMLADRTAALDAAGRARVEQQIVPLAPGRSRGWLRTLTDRAVIIADPAAAHTRHRDAVADRDVTCRPLPDGMGQLTATLPAHHANTVHTLLQILADTDPDHTRPIGARRADALTGIANTLLTHGHLDLSPLFHPHQPHQPSPAPAPGRTPPAAPAVSTPPPFRPPTRQGRPVDLVVTLSLSTLAGLDQLPGNLSGHGAITAEHARTLAAAARTITLLTLDPDTAAPTGISQRTYRPRTTQRDQTRTLNPHCTWPGCAQPSWRCDLDHRTPYNHRDPDHGGPTDLDNLDPQCRWHHLLKTHTNWTITRHPDRTLTITTPTGLTHHYPATEHTLPGEWTDQRNTAPTHDDQVRAAERELSAMARPSSSHPPDDPAPF